MQNSGPTVVHDEESVAPWDLTKALPYNEEGVDPEEERHARTAMDAKVSKDRLAAKRVREGKQKIAEKRIKYTATGEGIEGELSAWLARVTKEVDVSDLRKLCSANCLMTSGTKKELLARLVKCRYHGSPGRCSVCLQAKLEYIYIPKRIPL